jgi:4-carboxymuconolactone decarboxylase
MIAKMCGFHPELADWILEDGYGRVLSRPVLTVVERELLVVAVLATLNVPAQLKSHQYGALRVGATEPQVKAMLRLKT